MTRRVALVVGTGPEYGSGHLVRGRLLSELLQARGASVDLVPVSSPHVAQELREQLKAADVVLVDARDLDVRELPVDAPVLALDNQCAARGIVADRYFFHDSLPHPAVPLVTALENALIGEDVRRTTRGRGRHLLLYAPTRTEAQWRTRLLRGSGWSNPIVGCSGDAPLPRMRLVHLLANSQLCVTHFGMLLMEAWYLDVPVLLVPTRLPVHAHLAQYLQRVAGFPYLDDIHRPGPRAIRAALRKARVFRPVLRPGPDGFENLVERILSLAGAAG